MSLLRPGGLGQPRPDTGHTYHQEILLQAVRQRRPRLLQSIYLPIRVFLSTKGSSFQPWHPPTHTTRTRTHHTYAHTPHSSASLMTRPFLSFPNRLISERNVASDLRSCSHKGAFVHCFLLSFLVVKHQGQFPPWHWEPGMTKARTCQCASSPDCFWAAKCPRHNIRRWAGDQSGLQCVCLIRKWRGPNFGLPLLSLTKTPGFSSPSS